MRKKLRKNKISKNNKSERLDWNLRFQGRCLAWECHQACSGLDLTLSLLFSGRVGNQLVHKETMFEKFSVSEGDQEACHHSQGSFLVLQLQAFALPAWKVWCRFWTENKLFDLRHWSKTFRYLVEVLFCFLWLLTTARVGSQYLAHCKFCKGLES